MRIELLRYTTIEQRTYARGECVDLPEVMARTLIRSGCACVPGEAPPGPRRGGPEAEKAVLDH